MQGFGRFGLHLGLLQQILDDLEGCFRPAGVGDLRQGKVTLPVLYALTVDHPRRGELDELLRGGRLSREPEQALEIIEAAGAREYVVWAALEERKRARQALELPAPNSEWARAGRDALESFLLLAFNGLPELAGPELHGGPRA